MDFIAAERQREREAKDENSSSSLYTPKAQRPPSPDQKGVYMTEKTQPMNVAASGGGGDRHPGTPKPGGASFADSPLIANVTPHESYKIHVATKSDKIHRTPGIVRRVVEDVARLYYATGERPSLHLQGITGKGAWEEFTVTIGPLKDSPLALAMYRVDVFMKAFITGGAYWPQSGTSLEVTRRLAERNELFEAQCQQGGKSLRECSKLCGDCYDFQCDKKQGHLKNLYEEYKRLKVKGSVDAYQFSPYVQKCSVSKDGATFFFEPDIHVSNHGYNMQDGTPVDFSFDENQRKYVQLVKDAINSNSDLAYDLDIIHVACCAYALVQSMPSDRVCDVRDMAPVPSNEKMELLSPLQYGIVYYCEGCQREHLNGGCSPDWGAIHPEEVVGTPPSTEMSFAFDLPTVEAWVFFSSKFCLGDGGYLHAEWSRTLVENFDETKVLAAALTNKPNSSGGNYLSSQELAALARNPHESRLVGQFKPFASHLDLVEYYKSEAEKLHAAWRRQYTRKFTSGWKVDNFDAKAAVLEIAKQKGDSWTEKTLRMRLDIERCDGSFSFRKWGVERASREKKAPPLPPIKKGGCPDCVWDEQEQRYRGLCEKPRPTPPRPTKKKPPPVKDWGPDEPIEYPPITEGYPPCYVWDAQLKKFVPPRKCCRGR